MVQFPGVPVRELVIDQLAHTRGRPRDLVLAQIEEAGGDLEITSREAETLVARVEVVLDLPEIRTDRQGRRQRNSIMSLTMLVERSMAKMAAKVQEGGR